MSLVYFRNADTSPTLHLRRKIKEFIPLLFIYYKKELSTLNIIFCSDNYLLSLNRQFLEHDYYTDILTFDLSIGEKISGEIYISAERVKENASTNDCSFQDELLRIIFHGALHLCGFQDKNARQKKSMTQKEDLALLNFSKFHVKQ